ncbi:hypothetical protein AB1N83_008982, partial [Pleurotus pulmonarius]
RSFRLPLSRLLWRRATSSPTVRPSPSVTNGSEPQKHSSSLPWSVSKELEFTS